MKRWMQIAALGLLLGGSGVGAEMCTVDVVPAATLLVPYFEVDTENALGVNTIVSVHNALPQPILLNVTLWTDYSIPSISFHLYLTGYDVERINLSDMFLNGNIPITADLQSDPSDAISPNAGNSTWDGSFEGCDTIFPLYSNPVVVGDLLDRLVNGHTGVQVQSANQNCIGSNYGDDIARGYITLDVVNNCQLGTPDQSGYFDGFNPIASTVNAVWGEMSLIDAGNAFSVTEPLVHIEADPSFDSTSTDTGYTFYGRYTQALNGVDHREPLGTAWGVRYSTGAPFDGTDWVVWRDSTSSVPPTEVACNFNPLWYPLQETQVDCWSEQEDLVSICGDNGEDDPACFPLETQKVAVNQGDLALPWDFGWCRLDLNVPNDSFPTDVDFPSSGGNTTQSYVMGMTKSSGLYQVGAGAVQLGHACDPLPVRGTDDADVGVAQEVIR